MKVAIIVNPISGRGRPVQRLRRILTEPPFAGREYELILSQFPGHAGEIAKELCAEPPDLLVVCGGDGTINEVVSSVPEPPFPLAILPAGTANVLAQELRIPTELREALRVALGCKVRRVDLGCLESQNRRRFLLMAGIGFDARVVAATKLSSKRKLGLVAYYHATVRSMIAYSFDEFRVVTRDGSTPAISCVVANASKYGGGLVLTPQADIADGQLDTLVVEPASKLELLRFLISARLGRLKPLPFIRRLRTSSLKIEGPCEILVQVDGELAGALPVEITLAHCTFPLIVPA
jgi:YegS/Rv2252/BmrU family lipid kinase